MKPFLDMHQIPYDYYHVVNGNLSSGHNLMLSTIHDIEPLVDLCYDTKLPRIGEDEYALSASWYHLRCTSYKANPDMKQLVNHTATFFRHHCGAHADNALWTMFKTG